MAKNHHVIDNPKSVSEADMAVEGCEGWEVSGQTQNGVETRWYYFGHIDFKFHLF